MGNDMADAVAGAEDDTGKSGKLPLIAGVILALAGGAGGYFAVSTGVLPLGNTEPDKVDAAADDKHPDGHSVAPDNLPDIAFVALDPIVVSLGREGTVQHLRFRAQLEVEAPYQGDVEKMLPRVTDVLNSYLRALKVSDIEDRMALTKLRAQMLRRIQIVTGKGRVRDLLIMEFVLN